jgi:carboxymethylenebutenolidase
MTPNIVFQVFQLHRWALVIRAIRGVDAAVGCTRPTAAFATRCCLAGPAANIEGAPVAGGGMLDGRFALGTKITLTAADGFKLGGWRADPQGKPRGGLVVIQEIFGVNHHVRNVCDRFAVLGYAAVAPAVFDRIEPNFECGYTAAEVEHARTFIPKIDWAKMMLDTAAAIDAAGSAGKVGIVGYCLGGSVAFLAACKLDGLACAVGYYGGAIAKNADLKPKVPTLLHFGDQDHSIPLSDVAIVKAKRPDVEVHVYHAGHGFSCDERSSYDEAAHQEALERTTAWLGKYIE